MLIEDAILEYRAALLDGEQRLIAFSTAGDDGPRPGDILLGRVGRVARHINAAFIDIGQGRDGFLPLGNRKAPGEGSRLIVQMQSAKRPGKGARLGTDIVLRGQSMLLQPDRGAHGLSKKIRGADRARLEALLVRLPEQPPVLLRSNAVGHDDAALEAEYHRLAARWKTIRQRAESRKRPGMLEETGAPEHLLAEFSAREPAEILVEGGALAARLRRWCREQAHVMSERIRVHQGAQSLFDTYDVDHQLDEALSSVVALPSGGAIAIEPTQALTAIDIDSGGTGSGRSQRDTLLRTLREAMTEIARQIMLRDLGGIIAIDCPHLENPADRQAAGRWLKKALETDTAPRRILAMNDLDLLVMTRRHGGIPLHQRYLSPAAPRPAARLIAVRLLRRARAEAPRHAGRILRITCAPDIAACLDKTILSALRERTGCAIEVIGDAGRAPDDYDLTFRDARDDERDHEQ